MNAKLVLMRITQPIAGRFPRPYYALSRCIGWFFFQLRPGLRRKLVRNMLPLAGGDRKLARRLAFGSCLNVGRYYIDLCTLPYRNVITFESTNLEIEGGERLVALTEAGPVVAVRAHTGNAELAIQALTYRGRPFAALVEAQQPQAWADYLLRLRSSAGGRFYETDFGGIRACIETLRAGGLVGFMADRDLQGNGLCVELSGRCVRLPRGPWEVARRTNALVFPMFSSRIERDRFRVTVEEPFRVADTGDVEQDIRLAIERYVNLLEAHLRRDPSQWAVTEDFWRVHACG